MNFRYESPYTIQWFTGLFEGEGCIYVGKTRRGESYRPVVLRLCSTDKDVIESVLAFTNVGNVRIAKLAGKRNKTVYEWVVNKKPDVYKCLLRMRKHLHSRRQEKCDEALALLREDARVKELYS